MESNKVLLLQSYSEVSKASPRQTLIGRRHALVDVEEAQAEAHHLNRLSVDVVDGVLIGIFPESGHLSTSSTVFRLAIAWLVSI